ncbi:hydrogenase nickel incorporation protein HypB [Vibrio sp. S11_S32]|uniref:hydrogenase nickel incorporation protein HypB n=1 Tax=Vibrio sp. S11_S32 TaxID=2720225 RepID=UPI0016813B03|nr:hydrogenase nickel incorporation protein HypB [Vibrio sp. S11_S32]MBD1577169.1 hydrogenase nickel incorporation protein HypB [Vibrio sp. S11_S32]
MCGVCGCGDTQIEGHDHGHDHHSHGHHSHGAHSHGEHQHSHQHSHEHGHQPHAQHAPSHAPSGEVHHHHYPAATQVIIHHHHHYAAAAPHQAHEHSNAHSHAHGHSHHQHADHEHADQQHTHQAHNHAHASHSHAHHDHHSHDHDESENFVAAVDENNDLHYGGGEAGVHVSGISQRRLLKIETDILDKNNKLAKHNREHFKQDQQLVLNLVSSPGSGKTTLLTETLHRIQTDRTCAVIEGDQQTSNDADRVRATGAPAVQVNTGKGCHLDAQMVHDACHQLQLEKGGLLFIENVGNLVCPAGFDLGEKYKVAILSVTEGEDKPLKYPNMFAASQLMIINKIDLLPYVKFDVEACIANAKKVNPYIQVITVSATTGEGMQAWLDWLKTN